MTDGQTGNGDFIGPSVEWGFKKGKQYVCQILCTN